MIPVSCQGPVGALAVELKEAREDFVADLVWPAVAPTSFVKPDPMFAQPAQSDGSCIALRNRVCRNQSESPAIAKQLVSAAKKMGDQIGVAVSALVNALEPVDVVLGIRSEKRVLSGERWIADYRVESWIHAPEHFCELHLPVEWHDGRLSDPYPLGNRLEPSPGQHRSDRSLRDQFVLLPTLFALPVFILGNERRDRRIAGILPG